MREVDLMGFGRSSFFSTIRKQRFCKWYNIDQELLDSWIRTTLIDLPVGSSSLLGDEFVFENGGNPAPELRMPGTETRRWHIFSCAAGQWSQGQKTRYVGNFHAQWSLTVTGLQFDDIELCFMPYHRDALRRAFQKGLMTHKLKRV